MLVQGISVSNSVYKKKNRVTKPRHSNQVAFKAYQYASDIYSNKMVRKVAKHLDLSIKEYRAYVARCMRKYIGDEEEIVTEAYVALRRDMKRIKSRGGDVISKSRYVEHDIDKSGLLCAKETNKYKFVEDDWLEDEFDIFGREEEKRCNDIRSLGIDGDF